ncbi:universal stress protein [Roseovarius sp.]|uniref:universal stress protein n=1 Tax=Roseovarius sp. TaxID=1486281 RepID=UPI000C691010|nr:universal stress protein [Roseovarius sp.]MAZ22329.1 universal stress protein [Roseovarius sp.]
MYKHILVPMALDHGISPETLDVAKKLLAEGGKITALHIYEMPSGTVGVYLDEEVVRASFEAARTKMHEKLAAHPEVEPVIKKGHPARSIVDYAAGSDIDCIVIGSHKPGLRDFLLGSTAARVMRFAACSVHVRR